jgi:hypothetical protein
VSDFIGLSEKNPETISIGFLLVVIGSRVGDDNEDDRDGGTEDGEVWIFLELMENAFDFGMLRQIIATVPKNFMLDQVILR